MEESVEAKEILERQRRQERFYDLVAPAAILVCVLLFYAIPLLSSSTTIRGDTVNAYYALQKYVAERLFSGLAPFWTPYLYSGYPLLSSPLAGAWYPLNWLVFLAGVTPAAIKFELALHAAIACLGAYFALRGIVKHRVAAVAGAFAYGLSGFFAVQSGRLDAFIAAAWFPWLLAAHIGGAGGRRLRSIAMGAIFGGLMILGGHLQTAALGFIGLGLFAVADVFGHWISWRRAVGSAAAMILGALAISAIQLLPAWEVSGTLVASAEVPVPAEDLASHPARLFSVIWPRAGVSAETAGAADPGVYFYAGLLLLPMAILGFKARATRRRALFLIVPAIWFMIGPAAGLYRAGTLLPWMSGPPVSAGFLVTLALAMLAAMGFDRIAGRGGRGWVIAAGATMLLFGDLWYWNAISSPMAYERENYHTRYEVPEQFGRVLIVAPQLPLSRFDSPEVISGMGPLLVPLDLKFETTYGYLLPESRYYREYRAAMVQNPKLRDGLNVSRFLNQLTGEFDVNSSVLPRAYFPAAVREAANEEESRKALDALDPQQASIVLPPHSVIEQDRHAEAIVNASDERSYRVHYTAASPSLLKLSVPWYPGWRAAIHSHSLPIVRVDHALMGVVVPPGDADVEFTFAPHWFHFGAAISFFSIILLVVLASAGSIQRRFDQMLSADPNRQLHRHKAREPRYLAKRSSI